MFFGAESFAQCKKSGLFRRKYTKGDMGLSMGVSQTETGTCNATYQIIQVAI